jgi:GT2 family glycosyltransferase
MSEFFDLFVPDPGLGLPAAINIGIESLPEACKYVTWLGDDDLLTNNSLLITHQALKGDSSAVAVYGKCTYIDQSGRIFWTSTLGRFARLLLAFGPNRIPQPGSLFRRDSFASVGGLNPNLGWAFDQDLFMNLRKRGKFIYLPVELAKYRWHSDSLSAGQSERSVLESSGVRLTHARGPLRYLLKVMEPLHVFIALSKKSFLDTQERRMGK